VGRHGRNPAPFSFLEDEEGEEEEEEEEKSRKVPAIK
jgi:hypothetical protein